MRGFHWPLTGWQTVILAAWFLLLIGIGSHTPSGTHQPDKFAERRGNHRHPTSPPRSIRDRHPARRRPD